MEVKIYSNYELLSRAAADLIASTIRKKPDALICIASGHTPIGVYQCLADDINNGRIDASNVTFVSLDEWLDVDPRDPGSCISMLRKDFFNHVSLGKDQIETFDIYGDRVDECERINHIIERHGGLDVMLVGIGLNGHIGMNEPGTSFDTYAHVATLAQETITSAQKYFQRPDIELSLGITLGLRHFVESKLPIVMANGSKKAEIIKRVVESEVTEQLPASIVHKVPQALIMLDAEAAKMLQPA